ncbi:MAG: radical SAM family heme chaperone HemW [Ignavibacteria bacterium]|nr:radical SAM family heme chaperone HemW [Ignavibacteria bacterium]
MSGLYIHIPFCRKRCNYCDFFFITNTKRKTEFLNALNSEITLLSNQYYGEKFDTVFFGGGTPSVLTSEEISAVIKTLRDNLNVDCNSEITMESNPEDFTDGSIENYLTAGINRFSFGVQSFIDSELKFLTRQHTAEMAEHVIRKASELTQNISVDIIYSLPSQTEEDVNYSISKAIDSGARHISAYSLTYEKGTSLYKSTEKDPRLIKDPVKDSEFYFIVSERLTSEGFEHYEISNFARPGYRSRHNLKYWTYKNYLGLGPSSHSFFFKKRWNNVRSYSGYVNSLNAKTLPAENLYEPDTAQIKLEYIMLGLRSAGINFERYRELTGEDFETENKAAAQELCTAGLAFIRDGNLILTEKGYSIADEITARYF